MTHETMHELHRYEPDMNVNESIVTGICCGDLTLSTGLYGSHSMIHKQDED